MLVPRGFYPKLGMICKFNLPSLNFRVSSLGYPVIFPKFSYSFTAYILLFPIKVSLNLSYGIKEGIYYASINEPLEEKLSIRMGNKV